MEIYEFYQITLVKSAVEGSAFTLLDEISMIHRNANWAIRR